MILKGQKGDWDMVHYWRCCTGGPATPTPLGQFYTSDKIVKFDSEEQNYYCWWATRVHNDILIHSILYTHDPTGPHRVLDGTMGRNVSHGCIRLYLQNAEWVYLHIPAGTRVLTYR